MTTRLGGSVWFSRRPGCQIPAEVVANLRLQRDVARLHALGPRAILHLLDEICCRFTCRLFVENRAHRYAQIDRDTLAALGGDTFPPSIHAVSK